MRPGMAALNNLPWDQGSSPARQPGAALPRQAVDQQGDARAQHPHVLGQRDALLGRAQPALLTHPRRTAAVRTRARPAAPGTGRWWRRTGGAVPRWPRPHRVSRGPSLPTVGPGTRDRARGPSVRPARLPRLGRRCPPDRLGSAPGSTACPVPRSMVSLTVTHGGSLTGWSRAVRSALQSATPTARRLARAERVRASVVAADLSRDQVRGAHGPGARERASSPGRYGTRPGRRSLPSGETRSAG